MQQSSKVDVTVGGDRLRSKAGSSSIELGGYVVDEGSVEGAGYTKDMVYTEKLVPTIVKTTLMYVGDTDLINISKSRDITVSFVHDTKDSYVLAHAVALRIGPLQGGECTLSFASTDVSFTPKRK